MGLVFGWLRSVRPFFGRIPEAAIWIFDTVGLCVFIGVVGITAGPGFVTGLQKTGVSLVIVGLICSLTPHIVTILFGRYVLRMNPLILLGACAGAGTITAALRALQDEAQSKVPAIGYTVPYAIGNILLTAWGPVLVALMSRGRIDMGSGRTTRPMPGPAPAGPARRRAPPRPRRAVERLAPVRARQAVHSGTRWAHAGRPAAVGARLLAGGHRPGRDLSLLTRVPG